MAKMGNYIPEPLRKLVRQRAHDCCEYCLASDEDAVLPHEPDHVIAIKHGGDTCESNLAWACYNCNRRKGTDIASIDPDSKEITRLFNPRTDKFAEHLELNLDGSIIPLTPIGRTTAFFLDLNEYQRVLIRQRLQRARRFPR